MSALQEMHSYAYAVETHNPPAEKTSRYLDFPIGVVEISGPERFEGAARFLEENPWFHAAWVEKDLSTLPDSVTARDLDLRKILFIDGGKDASWAVSSMLKSGEFPIVVYHAPYGEVKELRRFRRQALQAKATLILIREEPCVAWPISLHIRATRGKLDVLKRRP